MSAHVLLNLLNKLRKRDEMPGLQSFYLFFATSLINAITQLCYGRHNVSRKSINH